MTKTIEQIKESLFMNTVLVKMGGIIWKDEPNQKVENAFLAISENVWNEYSDARERGFVSRTDRLCSLWIEIVETFYHGKIGNIGGIELEDDIAASCSDETVILIPDKTDINEGTFTIFPVKSLPESGSVTVKDIVWDTYDEDAGMDLSKDSISGLVEIRFNSRINILQYLFDEVELTDILTERFGFCVKSIGSIE